MPEKIIGRVIGDKYTEHNVNAAYDVLDEIRLSSGWYKCIKAVAVNGNIAITNVTYWERFYTPQSAGLPIPEAKSANFVPEHGVTYIVDATAGAITINCADAGNMVFRVIAAAGTTFDTNNVTIAHHGGNEVLGVGAAAQRHEIIHAFNTIAVTSVASTIGHST